MSPLLTTKKKKYLITDRLFIETKDPMNLMLAVFGNGQNAKMNSENGELKQHICNIHRRLRLLFSITISEYETYSMQ